MLKRIPPWLPRTVPKHCIKIFDGPVTVVRVENWRCLKTDDNRNSIETLAPDDNVL